MSFNVYAWAFSANITDASINWTNNLSTNVTAPGQSGYSIMTTAVPEPHQTVLLVIGLCVMLMVLRSSATNRKPNATRAKST